MINRDPMSSETLFSWRNLQFLDLIHYPDGSIPAGNITFITGESGTGKSTLLKLLNRSMSPSGGTIQYRNRSLEEYPVLSLRREVSLVAQSAYVFPGTIRENFREFHELRGQACPDDSTIRDFLEICRLDLSPDHRPDHLSGGERHRLYMALFLSFSPRVLLLDEPTAALDPANSRGVLEGIGQYARSSGMSLVVVSHELGLAGEYADRILDLGKRRKSNG